MRITTFSYFWFFCCFLGQGIFCWSLKEIRLWLFNKIVLEKSLKRFEINEELINSAPLDKVIEVNKQEWEALVNEAQKNKELLEGSLYAWSLFYISTFFKGFSPLPESKEVIVTSEKDIVQHAPFLKYRSSIYETKECFTIDPIPQLTYSSLPLKNLRNVIHILDIYRWFTQVLNKQEILLRGRGIYYCVPFFNIPPTHPFNQTQWMPFFSISFFNIPTGNRERYFLPAFFNEVIKGPRFRVVDQEIDQKMKELYLFEKDPLYRAEYTDLKVHLAHNFTQKHVPQGIIKQIFSYVTSKDINWKLNAER